MQDLFPNVLIPSSAAVGVLFAVFLWQRVSKISMSGGSTFRSQNGREYLLVREWAWGGGGSGAQGGRGGGREDLGFRQRGARAPRKAHHRSRARVPSPLSRDHHDLQEEEQRGDDEVR